MMASYTTNLHLKKPAASEKVSIADINGNMDILDAAYDTVNDNISAVQSRFGNVRYVGKNIPGNSNIRYDFSDACAFLIFCASSAAASRCVIMGYCGGSSSNSTASLIDFGASSQNITLTFGQGYIQLNNGGSSYTYTTFMVVSGTAPT